MLFMARWLNKHAPEVTPALDRGEGQVTPLYRRLKREYDLAFFRFLGEQPEGPGRLFGYRVDGKFCFVWRPE